MLLEELKGLPTTLNFLAISGLISIAFYKRGKNKWAKVGIGITLCLFLLVSTPFLPRYVFAQLEGSFTPLNSEHVPRKDREILIHVLGAGYSLDPNLPATSQLDLITLGRLAEGLRICNELSQSILVCSGGSSVGLESQASVVRRAAISLGLEAGRIRILSTPSSTEEEAKALANAFGTEVTLILVTDAYHMARAIRLFEEEGFRPIPAPTNYVVKSPIKNRYLTWIPSVKNMLLTDRIVHELLGNIKASLL